VVEIVDMLNLAQPYMAYIKAILILVVAFIVIGFISRSIRRYLSTTILPPDTQNLLRRTGVYILWFIAIMSIMVELNLEKILIPIMGLSVLAGAAVALAVKNILADALAGIFLLLDGHFNIGDQIETMKYKGEIIDVTLRKTRVKIDDGTIVVLPNGKIDSSGWVLHKKMTETE
jgi:small-conductance mechanosensitive channel